MALCKEMVLELGLPDVAVNPQIARSFMSHMRVIEQPVLYGKAPGRQGIIEKEHGVIVNFHPE